METDDILDSFQYQDCMILNYLKDARFIKGLCVRVALTETGERCWTPLEA